MLLAGSADVVVAGGMESMTNAPHLMLRAQGHQVRRRRRSTTTWRSTAWKTPTSAAGRWACSPRSASAKYSFSARRWTVRDRLDRARASRPTRTAASTGRSRRSTVPGKGGDTVVKLDEQPFKAKLDKIPGLKPAFKKDGTITAADLVEHLRRRRGAGDDARVARAKRLGVDADRAHRRPRRARAGAGVVRDRAGRRHRRRC